MACLPSWLREAGGHREPYDLGLSDWFWSIISRLRDEPESAEAVVNAMTREQLRTFYHAYREATAELYGDYRDEERGWDDDDIQSASCWVLNQGKEFYIAVWNDLSRYPDPRQVEGGDYSGLVAHVSWERHRQELCG